jgi:hypothetical protein
MKAQACALLLVLACYADAENCPATQTVRVEVPVAAEVDSPVLASAQQEAAWILKSLCATVEWGPGMLVVRILEEPLTSDSTADAMGIAIPRHGRGAIFLSRVRARVEMYRGKLSLATLLGCVLAHEIGHLLLGPEHSPDGIMRADFGKCEMERAGQRHLVFTAAERRRLR